MPGRAAECSTARACACNLRHSSQRAGAVSGWRACGCGGRGAPRRPAMISKGGVGKKERCQACKRKPKTEQKPVSRNCSGYQSLLLVRAHMRLLISDWLELINAFACPSVGC
jgi:hypothetical protein